MKKLHLNRMLNSNERGAILIWLIFILVAAGIFGSSMVYLTTSSTYDELLANNQARAYYIAEAGGRFAVPQIIQNPDTAETNLHDKEFTLHPGAGDPGGDGTFHLWLEDINSDPIEVISTGIVNAGSWLEGRRRITYGIEIQTFSTSFDDQVSFDNSWDIVGGSDLADIFGEDPDKIEGCVDDKPAERMKDIGQDFEIVTVVNWFEQTGKPQLDELRAKNGGFLSYQLQVKFKLCPQGVSMGNHFMVGLSFRLDTVTDSSYGISFFRSTPCPCPPSTLPPPDPPHPDVTWFNDFAFDPLMLDGNTWIVLWKQVLSVRTVLDYKSLVGSVVDDGTGDLKDWSTIAVQVIESDDDEHGTTRHNDIIGFIQGPDGPDGYPRDTISEFFEDNFNPVQWPTLPVELPPPPFVDYTLTSDINFDTPPFPYEVGIHAFYDGQANNDLFFDDFSLFLLGTGNPFKPIQY